MNSCEIVAQVMNIRDKLLGASSFRVTLSKQPDSEVDKFGIWFDFYYRLDLII